MATRRNNRKGPRGKTDARTIESPVPGTSSASDSPLYKDLLEFIRVNAIRDRLQEATVNNDRDSIQDRFITEYSLRKIWNGGLLRGLLEVLGYEDNGLVGDILMNLIKTISILVSIRWDEWPRFGGIFLEYRDGAVLRHDRKDRALPHSLQVLGDPSFLGKSWAVDFSRMQSSFLPIIVEQGKIVTYPRTRPLPFIRSKREKIATGAYGVVTKETIAKYQFLPQNDYNSRDLHKVNNFRLSTTPFILEIILISSTVESSSELEIKSDINIGRTGSGQKVVPSERRFSQRSPESSSFQRKSLRSYKDCQISCCNYNRG